MELYIDRLNDELKNILGFWSQYAFYDNHKNIYPEVSNNGTGNLQADTGTIYMARVLFGISAAGMHFKTKEYNELAQTAFNILTGKHKNPEGGYYWGINRKGDPVHHDTNVSFAQAFVIYGLCEYYNLTHSEKVLSVINNQIEFIENNLYDFQAGGYLDGYNVHWKPIEKQSKSLGTIIHMMEAYSKYLHIRNDENIKIKVRELLELVLDKIIDKNTYEAFHFFETDWKTKPNENWVGHNMEISWLICETAGILKDDDLTKRCYDAAINLVEYNLKKGLDNTYGGMYNILKNGMPVTQDKEYWPQAETAIALINAFKLTNNKYYLNDTIRLIEFIDGTISDEKTGEWYNSVEKEGKPIDTPKLHFWKSMYHNVRYCIQMVKRMQELIN